MSDALKDLSILVRHVQDMEENVTKIEAELAKAKDRLHFFKTDLIPTYMYDLGLEKVTTNTGHEVSVKTSYYGNISEERLESATKWLEEHGDGSLVKTTIGHTFGKGEEEQVDKLVLLNFLQEHMMEYNEKKGVHPQTLKAFIKRKLEAGEIFPHELFGVYVAKELVVE
jgi:hypothetical protein